MKRFAFNLETVLEYRSRQEDEAVREQAEAQRYRLQKERALARTRDNLDNSLAGAPVGTNLAELLHTAVYHVHLNRVITRQTGEAEAAAREWNLCRERTLVRHRDRLVLEMLKEKKHAEFMLETGRQEQKENDEISLQLHVVRRGGQ
ncbi:MAG TPA: flagellar export protein FliJ [Spirochaetia bacterium]|nr:flagellar export protein FliJ [Spirochaetia bacterium]